MNSSQKGEKQRLFSKGRIDTLTDGVFAFAMTMLVTGLDIPKINGIITSNTIDKILVGLAPDFIHYLLAFILLANFWWAHHERSHYIHAMDKRMIFLNIVSLLFVGLIPFSTNLVGDFPLNTHAALIFELNLVFLGFLSLLQWNQVLRNIPCLNEDADIEEIILGRDDAIIFPALSMIGIFFALSAVSWGIFVYALAPVYIICIKLWKTQSHKRNIPHT
ncbi:MAG: TMEM175 family protein [Methanoregulaceae archaeon]